MTPERQRIAIAEACGWQWRKSKMVVNRKYVLDRKTREGWHSPLGVRHGDVPSAGKESSLVFVPHYLHDLNAMHEAAMSLRVSDPLKYVHYAAAITAMVAKHNSDLEDGFSISAHDATAAQRAEAFLKTIGKWEDERQS